MDGMLNACSAASWACLDLPNSESQCLTARISEVAGQKGPGRPDNQSATRWDRPCLVIEYECLECKLRIQYSMHVCEPL